MSERKINKTVGKARQNAFPIFYLEVHFLITLRQTFSHLHLILRFITRKIERNGRIIIERQRFFRIKQIVQRYLYPVPCVRAQNERSRFLFTAHNVMRFIHRNKHQSVGIVVAVGVLNKVFLNCTNFKFANCRAFRRCARRRNRTDSAKRRQILLRRCVCSDNFPKTEPQIVDSSRIVKVIARRVRFDNDSAEHSMLFYAACLRAVCL